MILGIDCSRYAAEKPTGVELYTNHLVEGIILQADTLGYDEIRLYVKNAQQLEKLLYLIETSAQKTLQVKLIERPYLWTLLWLSLEMLRRPVDVLFVPSHTLPLVVPGRSILTVHGVEALLFPQAYSLQQRWYQQFSLWWAKKKGAQLIAVSEAVKKDLVRIFQISEEMVKVVWNGVEKVQSSKFKVQSEKTFSIEGKYVLNVGRLEERKNQLRLIEAFEQIAAEFPNLQLVLVGGDGYGAEKIHARVDASPAKERIQLTGYLGRDVVQQLMERAELFVYPSLAEGFGIPILEAFAAGVPVLTSQGSATEEVGGGAVVLCDPLSVESIASALRQLLSDETLCKQKIREGKKRLDLFSWDRCIDETMKILKKDAPIRRSSF